MKEAYVGEPSRAFFPLTPEFAAGSNNSTVAMTSTAIIIPVLASRVVCFSLHRLYSQPPTHFRHRTLECEMMTWHTTFAQPRLVGWQSRLSSRANIAIIAPLQVETEICAPIVTQEGKVLGIIDVEAWRANHFTQTHIDLVLYTCQRLADANLFMRL